MFRLENFTLARTSCSSVDGAVVGVQEAERLAGGPEGERDGPDDREILVPLAGPFVDVLLRAFYRVKTYSIQEVSRDKLH